MQLCLDNGTSKLIDFKWIEINAIVKQKSPHHCHSHTGTLPPLGHGIDNGILLGIRGVFQRMCLQKRLNGLATAPWIGVETSCSLWRLLGKAERTVPIKMLLGKLRWTEIAHVLFSVATSGLIGALSEKT